jgi:hypothetical protein
VLSGSAASLVNLPALFTPTPAAANRTLKFFTANICNPIIRRAYARAVATFAAWCEVQGLQISPRCGRSKCRPMLSNCSTGTLPPR